MAALRGDLERRRLDFEQREAALRQQELEAAEVKQDLNTRRLKLDRHEMGLKQLENEAAAVKQELDASRMDLEQREVRSVLAGLCEPFPPHGGDQVRC